MDDANEDPVLAIEIADKILSLSDRLRDMTPNMVLNAMTPEGIQRSHPMDEIETIMNVAKSTLYGKYGEMLYESPDGAVKPRDRHWTGAVDQSHSEDNLPVLSSEVSPEVREETGDQLHPEAIENGLSILRRLGGMDN